MMMKRIRRNLILKSFLLAYEGEDTAQGGQGGDTTQGGSGDDTGPGGQGGGGDDPELTRLNFTPEQQKLFNKRMAEERRKLREQNEKTIGELKKLQQEKGITEKQRHELQARIEELQSQSMSKEEVAKREREKLQKQHQQELETHKKESETWRSRFHKSTIMRAIQDSALELEAYNPQQIVDMLETRARLVEATDAEGQSIPDDFVAMVKFHDFDKEGKPVVLDLNIKDAIKRMRDLPEKFGNLFKSGVAGGLGQGGSPNGNRKKIDPAKMGTAAYLEARKKDPNLTFTEQK